ncbi:hypothetical protein GCM10027435_04080 [Haloparvum alkalitolerans]|uniref:hypothetical protein n=1 Tax=Haloparvum alkalitolerans TaxID=1042953 RepID=UPI003CEB4C46
MQDDDAPEASGDSAARGTDAPADLDTARDLRERAEADPSGITTEEMGTAVSLLACEDPEVRVTAAEVLQHVFDRPALFEPFVPELVEASATYPDEVEGIPSPQQWMASDRLRAVVYVADALARVAQRAPAVVEPHADRLVEAVRSEANAPSHHAFTLGYVAARSPDAVPTAEVRAALRDLLDRGRGNGFPSFAAHALGEIGDPDDLPAVREAHPGATGDEALEAAFDDAVEKLESGDATDADR